MELSYSEKLQRIRTGVEVVALAKKKLEGEARQLLNVADRVYVDYLGAVRAAGVLGFTSDGLLDLELQPGGLNVFLSVDRLVEAPTP